MTCNTSAYKIITLINIKEGLKMLSDTIEYRNHTIKVYNDEFPQNPFEDWDGLPSLLASYDDHLNNYGSFDFDYLPALTREEIKANLSTVMEILTDYNDLWAIKEETHCLDGYSIEGGCLVDKINDLLQSYYSNGSLSYKHHNYCEKFTIISQILTIKGVVHLLTDSRGYSQGDYVEMLLVGDNNYLNEHPVLSSLSDNYKEKLQKELKSSADLYSSWAWGDVYGFEVEYEKGQEIGSCWGFYGSDHEQSGLLEHAKNTIDCYIQIHIQKRLSKTKELIKNKVALSKRKSILDNIA